MAEENNELNNTEAKDSSGNKIDVIDVQTTLNNWSIGSEALSNNSWSFPFGLNPIDNQKDETNIIDIDKYWNFNNVTSQRIDVEFLKSIDSSSVADWININELNQTGVSNANNYIVSMNIVDNGVKELNLVLYDRNFTDLQKIIANSIQVINKDISKETEKSNNNNSFVGKIKGLKDGGIEFLTSPQKVTSNIRVRYGYNESLNEKVGKNYKGLGNINNQSEGYYRWRSSTSGKDINALESASTQDSVQDISSDTVLAHHYQQSTILSEWEEFFIAGISTTLVENGIKYDIKGISTSKMALDGYKMIQQYSKIVGKPKTILSTFMNMFNNNENSPIKLVWADKTVSAANSAINGEELVFDYESGKYFLVNEEKKDDLIKNISKPINDLNLYIKTLSDLKACFVRNDSNTIPDYIKGHGIEYSNNIGFVQGKQSYKLISLETNSFMDIAGLVYNSTESGEHKDCSSDIIKRNQKKADSYMYAMCKDFNLLFDFSNNKDKGTNDYTVINTTSLLKMWISIISSTTYENMSDFTFLKEYRKNKDIIEKSLEDLNAITEELEGNPAVYLFNKNNDEFMKYITGSNKEISINCCLQQFDIGFGFCLMERPNGKWDVNAFLYDNMPDWVDKDKGMPYYSLYNDNWEEINEESQIDNAVIYTEREYSGPYSHYLKSLKDSDSDFLIKPPIDQKHPLCKYEDVYLINKIMNDGTKLDIYEKYFFNLRRKVTLNSNSASYLLNNIINNGNDGNKYAIKFYTDINGETGLNTYINTIFQEIFNDEIYSELSKFHKKDDGSIKKNYFILEKEFNNKILEIFSKRNSIDICYFEPGVIDANGNKDLNIQKWKINSEEKEEIGGTTYNKLEAIAYKKSDGTKKAITIIMYYNQNENDAIKKAIIEKYLLYVNNILNFITSLPKASYLKSDGSKFNTDISNFELTEDEKKELTFDKFYCKKVQIEDDEAIEILTSYKLPTYWYDSLTSFDSNSDRALRTIINNEYYYFLKELGTRILKIKKETKLEEKTFDNLKNTFKDKTLELEASLKELKDQKFLKNLVLMVRNNIEEVNVNNLKRRKIMIKEPESDNDENAYEIFGKIDNGENLFDWAFRLANENGWIIDKQVNDFLKAINEKIESLNDTLQEINKKIAVINNSNVGKEIELSLGSQESANPNNKITKTVSSLLNDFCSQCQPKISKMEKNLRGLEEDGTEINNSSNVNKNNVKMMDASTGEEKKVDIYNGIPRYNLTWGIVGEYKGNIPVIGLYYKEPIKVSKLRKYNWGPGNAKLHCIKNLSIANGSEFALMHNFNSATVFNDNNMLIEFNEKDSKGNVTKAKLSSSDKYLSNPFFFNKVFDSERDKNTFNNLLNSVNKGSITLLGDPSLRFGGVVQPYTYPIYLNINLARENAWYTTSTGSSEYYNEVSQLSGYYVITKITHSMSMSGFTTTIEVMKYPGSSNLRNGTLSFS